jgi:outer membrane protein OmpA-like peptidoglycan-associated protein
MWRSAVLTLLLQSQPNWLEIGDAQSRCSLQGCLVEVTTTKPAPQHSENITKEQTSVFYEEDRFFLHYDLRKRIRDFLQEHPSQTRFVITGWTDGCGEHDYNKLLSKKRANEVARYIIQLRKGALVELRWVGEATGKHTIRARRVDVAVLKKTQQTITPPKIIYDYYLIDGSGSLSGPKWNKWIGAISYWKPRGAKVFVATANYLPHKTRLDRISPSGGTEVWLAVWVLLDKIPPGKTLLIISDFRSTVPLTARERERINQKASQKKVRIRYVKL